VSLVELAARRTFRSLRIRNYRLFFLGQLVSLTGTWMQQVAQDWLVLRLTDRALPVGITTALQFLPVLLFAAWGGLAADRVDKRRLLAATQAAMGTLALVLGVLTLTGSVRLWMVYLLAFLLGCATAFDMPARQAFVTEMVGSDQVSNAVALNSAVVNSARVVGPAAAGVLIATVGIAPAFLLNAVSYLAVIAGLLAMDPAELHRRAPAPRAGGQVRAGLRHVWATPVLRSTLLLVAVVGTLGVNTRVVLPLLARFTFQTGPGGYGLLASVAAAGSVVGALAVASRARPTRRLLLGSAAALGVVSLAAAAAPTFGWELAALVPLGVATITFLATANSTLQLASSPQLRGRVMALYGIVFLGSTPLGSVVVGWLAERYGPRSGLVLGGVASLVAVAVALLAGSRQAGAGSGAGASAGGGAGGGDGHGQSPDRAA
jgi:MFS family permease